MDEQEQAIWEGLGVSPDEEPEQPREELDDEELEEADLQEPEDTDSEQDDADGGEESDEQEDSGSEDIEAIHQQELERVRREGQAAVDAQVAAMGLQNPYDGNKPITTAAEYAAYQAAAREASVAEFCRKAGITREQFDALVAGDPEVQAAKDIQARAQAAEQAAQEQRAAARLDAEIAEIRKLCPEIKDRESLVAHKSWEKIRDRMRATGDGVLDAFKSVNFDDLQRRAADNARRQSARNQKGKAHLKGTTGKGKGGASIPDDQLRIYQRLNPNASLEELQAFHAANNRK